MISGCTGRKITLIDILSIFGLSTFLFISNENSIYIIPFIIGMATLIFFKEETKVAIAFLAIAIIGFLIGSFYFNYLLFSSTEFSSLVKITVTVFLVLSILLINYIKISGLLDDTGKEVVSTRIRLSQMIYPAIILLLFWFTPMSYGNLLIYLAVLIGIFLYSLL